MLTFLLISVLFNYQFHIAYKSEVAELFTCHLRCAYQTLYFIQYNVVTSTPGNWPDIPLLSPFFVRTNHPVNCNFSLVMNFHSSFPGGSTCCAEKCKFYHIFHQKKKTQNNKLNPENLIYSWANIPCLVSD